MSKISALFDTAIATRAKQEKRLKRTIRKHVVEALVSQATAGKLSVTESQAQLLLDGDGVIEPAMAILLGKILGLAPREILDAQVDDQLSAAGDTTSRAAAEPAAPSKPAKASKPATRTSPMKPAPRRTEVTGTL